MLRAHYYIALKFTENPIPDKFYKQVSHSISGLVFDLQSEFEIGQPIICVDSYPSFRSRIFPEYKAHRDKDERFQKLREAVMPMVERDFFTLKLEELEADDLLSMIAMNGPTIIVTRDLDMLQSLGDAVLYDFRKKTFTFCEDPGEALEDKILKGCKGDNIPSISVRGGPYTPEDYQRNYNLVAHDIKIYEQFVNDFNQKYEWLKTTIQECSYQGSSNFLTLRG